MLKLLKTKISPIGLDIGHDSIKMIQVARSDGAPYVIAAERMRFDPEIEADPEKKREFTINAIREMLEHGRFRGRKVISSLSNDNLRIKSLRLSVSDNEQIEELVKTEIAEGFGFDAGDDEIRYIVAGKVYHGDEVKHEVILFAADRATIEEHISVLEEVELVPVAIDPIPCALLRNFQRSMRRQEDQEAVQFFIDIGSRFTTVMIGSNQDVCFIKQIPIAGGRLNQEVASRLGINIDEAVLLRSKLRSGDTDGIALSTRQTVIDAMESVNRELSREISLCHRYYSVTFRGKVPQRALLTGGEAYEPTLFDALKKCLNVEIEFGQPLRGFDLSRTDLNSEADSPLCEWAVATGLSVKGWDFIPDRTVNYERN